MIPKKIHYCWFGPNELTPLSEKCLSTWNEYLGGYEIFKWSENNIDLTTPVIKDALNNKMWAFASDYVRLKVLYEYGGIYLDTDMEIIKDLDIFLDNRCFLGRESPKYLSAGIIGAEKNNKFIGLCLKEMERLYNDGIKYTTIPRILTTVYDNYNDKDDISLFEPDVFYPYNPYDKSSSVRQLMYLDIKNSTYAIHHWEKSWAIPHHKKIYHKVIGIIRGQRG